MPNQNTPKTGSIYTCANPECTNTFYRTLGQIKRAKKNICCSRECNHKTNKNLTNRGKKKYSDENIQFMKDNALTLGFSGMAAALGVEVSSLKSMFWKLRQLGHDMPYIRRCEDGSQREVMVRGEKRVKVKVDGRWILSERKHRALKPEELKKKRIKPERRVKPLKPEKIITSVIHKMPKKEEKKLATRVVDASQLKSVRIDAKTVIQVRKDVPDEVAISNWFKNRKAS